MVSVVGVSLLGGITIHVKWLHIRLRSESLDDTDDADDSTFVDFVGC